MDKALTQAGMAWSWLLRQWPVMCIGLLVVFICLPQLAQPGVLTFRRSMDWGLWEWSQRFPYLLWDFKETFLQGFLYPRWLPELMGGNGYPTFLFYQPGLFFFALPFALLLPDIVLAAKLALMTALLLGGLGAYRLCRQFVSRAAALSATILFLLNPYLLVSYHIRHADAEIFGMMAAPWCLYSLCVLQRRWLAGLPFFWPATGFAVSLGVLFVAHPFVTLHCAPLFALTALALWRQARFAPRLALVMAICLMLGLVFASPYLLGVLQMREYINYRGIQFTYLGWLQPLSRLLAANPLSTLLVLYALWLHRREPLGWALGASWLWLTFINTEYAKTLWQNFPPLEMTQIPYRAYAADMQLKLLASALAFAGIQQWAARRAFGAWVLPAALLAVLAAMLANPIALPPDARAPLTWEEVKARHYYASHAQHRKQASLRYNDESLRYDFLPSQVDIKALKQKEQPFSRPQFWESPPGIVAFTTNPEITPNYSHFTVVVPENDVQGTAPITVHLRQFYIPGWAVVVENERLPENTLAPDFSWRWLADEDGRIQLQFLTPGRYRIKIWYDGPPYAMERNALMLAFGLSLLWALLRLQRTRQPVVKE